MMQEIIRLIRIDHDNLENRNAIHTKCLGTFIGDDGSSAYSKVDEFIHNIGPKKFYLGWDGNVYPQFRLEKEYLR